MSTGYIVFAHGSSIETANQAVRTVAAEMAERGGLNIVEAAFLEGGQPSLAGALASMADRVTHVVVVPYFLTLGLHLKRDLPRLIAKHRPRALIMFGLAANTPFYNTALAIVMWFGRFAMIVPILAAAGSLAKKKVHAATAGTLPTNTPLFAVTLGSIVLIVGALTYKLTALPGIIGLIFSTALIVALLVWAYRLTLSATKADDVARSVAEARGGEGIASKLPTDSPDNVLELIEEIWPDAHNGK